MDHEQALEAYNTSILAKFKVERHEVVNWPGGVSSTEVVLTAVWDDTVPENKRFAAATPWGELKMAVNNPLALIKLQPGREFYLNFVAVPEPVKVQATHIESRRFERHEIASPLPPIVTEE